MEQSTDKDQVKGFWNQAACGEELYLPQENAQGYEAQKKKRYELEPYILDFACFSQYQGKKVLEIGVGLGADHEMFVRAGALTTGIDLTERAILQTKKRLESLNLTSTLFTADAEKLPFPDEHFDLVYSWGVLHHSPRTDVAIKEVFRVLKPQGEARIMIYHKYSLVGVMLWIRYALLALKPWRSLKEIYSAHLESPGTKAYSQNETLELFEDFTYVRLKNVMTHADLLESQAGQRHPGLILKLARLFWPRHFFKKFFPAWGLFLLIEAQKNHHSTP